MKTIAFVGWDLSKEDLTLANNIKGYFIKLFKEQNIEVTVDIHDLKTLGETKYKNDCCIFGDMPKRYCEFESDVAVWSFPSFVDMRKSKKDSGKKKKLVMELLESMCKVTPDNTKQEQKVETYVKKEGKKVGSCGVCDIQINKKEIEYLNKIKSLLGGGTVVLRKGDMSIEVN
jgi:hypothetical protein